MMTIQHGYAWLGLATICTCALAADVASAEVGPGTHAPDYENQQLWPNLSGEEYFLDEQWPEARLLVWRHPGTSDSGRQAQRRDEAQGDLDPMDPANWLVDGERPATEPPDENTDLYFPDADRIYYVGGVWGPHLKARHVTVGRNAVVGVKPLHGNLWIRRGGRFSVIGYGRDAFRIVGTKHTFFRNDNGANLGDHRNEMDQAGTTVALWMLIEKTRGGSVEFLGTTGVSDELKLNSGTTIVGPGSALLGGSAAKSIQVIGPDAELVLTSGATFQKSGNYFGNSPDVIVQGRLSVGTPARPLQHDAYLGLSFKSEQADRLTEDDSRGQGPNVPPAMTNVPAGFLVEPQGRLRVVSEDPERARLIIHWHGHDMYSHGERTHKDTPRLIDMALLGKVDLNGVLLNHVKRGGVRLPDPSAREQWEHLQFGEDNGGPAETLFQRYEGPVAYEPIDPSRRDESEGGE